MFEMMGNMGVETSTLHFVGEISFDTVAHIVAQLDEIPSDKVQLHFASPGGGYSAMKSLVHTINNHEKQIDIVLVGIAASAGFLFLCECTRPIYVEKSAFGMIHYGDIEIRARELKDSKSFSSFMLRDIENLNIEMLEHAMRLGVADKDLEDIDSGKDYWVSYDTLKEWFHTATETERELTPKEEREKLIEEIANRTVEKMATAMLDLDSIFGDDLDFILGEDAFVDHSQTIIETDDVKVISKEEEE